jgi:hypothetical protein
MNDNPYQWEAAVDRSQNGRVLVSGPVVAGKPWPLRVTDNAAAEDLVARINGTNQPTGDVRPDLLDGTNLIRHWLVGRTVDSVGLAAELRQWADTVDPWKDQPTVAAKVNGADAVISGDFAAYLNLTSATDLPDDVWPWGGDEADAVAPCRIVHNLDARNWWWSEDGYEWHELSDLNPGGTYPVLLRRKPQTVTVTVELPKDATDEQILTAAREALDR